MANPEVGTFDQYVGAPTQCTEWASARYHALTGIWVPWQLNGGSWDQGARQAGWVVSSSPAVPSIMNLPAGCQGAGIPSEPGIGHVNIVESINSDGSVRTSNRNWPVGAMGPVYLNFSASSGCATFIWFPGKATGKASPTGAPGSRASADSGTTVPAGFQAAAALVPVLLIGIAVLALGMAGMWLYSQVK